MHFRFLTGPALGIFLVIGQVSDLCDGARPVEGEAKNIILIVADDLRADVLSVYGGPVDTPNLEALAKRGCRFNQATCGYPICHVSRTEILTGRWMVNEAISGRPIEFRSQWTLLPRMLQRSGWQTVHVGKWHCRGNPWDLGYVRTDALYSSGSPKGAESTIREDASGRPITGYTRWSFKTDQNESIPELGIGLTPETDRIIADGAIRSIDRCEKSMFLHVNFTAPHDPLLWPHSGDQDRSDRTLGIPLNFASVHPFDHGNRGGRDESIVPAPRTEKDVLEQRAVYGAVIRQLDQNVGRIIAALRRRGMLDETLVIFTSDHGLALGSHGLMGKQNQYEHTAGVPLMIAGPGVKQASRSSVQCALRDLFPSICELLSLEIPSSVQGKSLVSVLAGDQAEIHPAVYGYFKDSQRMIRRPDGWKLISYPRARRIQLFQISQDPMEMVDRSTDPNCQPVLETLQEQLGHWLDQQAVAK